MNTDPIPEAREAAHEIADPPIGMDMGSWAFEEFVSKKVVEACLSYHSRKLAECGDAEKTAAHICNLFATSYMDVHAQAGPWGTKHVDDITNILQLHTAKAVEEATEKLVEDNERDIDERNNWLASVNYKNGKLTQENTTLQKQCEELRQQVSNLSLKVGTAEGALLGCLHNDIDEGLRQRIKDVLKRLS